MSTNTDFRHYGINYIAKTESIQYAILITDVMFLRA